MIALNPIQLEILKLFEYENPTAEELITLRRILHEFLKKKNLPKLQTLEKQIFEQVKAKVLAIDKDAKVILFGSRARGDERKDSDWDFLILTSQELSFTLKNEFRNSIYEIELETGEVIGTLIHSFQEWKERQHTNIHKNIVDDGVEI